MPKDESAFDLPSNPNVELIELQHGAEHGALIPQRPQRKHDSQRRRNSVEALPGKETNKERDDAWRRFRIRLLNFAADISSALTEDSPDCSAEEATAQLSVFELNQNIRRCAEEALPYLESFLGFRELFSWQRPLSTLLLFWTYVFCLWNGCVVSAILSLILVQMALNYLHYRCNIRIGINLLPKRSLANEASLDLPQGVRLINEVARKVQLYLRYAACFLEKIKNLLVWKRPDVSGIFCAVIAFHLILSLSLTHHGFTVYIGLTLGWQLFVMQYLYCRFPRLRQMIDIFVWMYNRVPSDYTQTKARKRSNYQIKGWIPMESDLSTLSASTSVSSNESGERTLAWECVLLDKQKKFPYVIGRGWISLEESSIAFHYRSFGSTSCNSFCLPYSSIIAVKKSSLLKIVRFGEGTALDVFTMDRREPFVFAGLSRRDECYRELCERGTRAGYVWTNS